MNRRIVFINPPVLAADRVQVDLYAEALPFGLLQVATWHSLHGDQVRFLDMMEYLDEDGFADVFRPERRFVTRPTGDIHCRGRRDLYLLGKPLSWLKERLMEGPAPDEIAVTSCISFNYETTHAVVRLCREMFPRAHIRLGGFYPSTYPEHALASGADEVFVGRHREADQVFPALDLLRGKPKLWLFRLVYGCRYRCSFCMNRVARTDEVADPGRVVDAIEEVGRRYGVRTFSNWDPNVMLGARTLTRFLDLVIERSLPIELKFEMGVQPDRLTRAMAEKMARAGVTAMTIPFESSEPEMRKRFGKPYSVQQAMDAVAIGRELGLDTSRFHCTFVIGIRGEGFRHVFRTYFAILKAGGRPTPFPLSPAPGTREYRLHEPYLRGKDLADLNGHLWPTLASDEEVALYDLLFRIVNEKDARRAQALAGDLPREAREEFDRQMAWYLEGPHSVGDPVA